MELLQLTLGKLKGNNLVRKEIRAQDEALEMAPRHSEDTPIGVEIRKEAWIRGINTRVIRT